MGRASRLKRARHWRPFQPKESRTHIPAILEREYQRVKAAAEKFLNNPTPEVIHVD